MNLLILSAGRRVSLVRNFVESVERCGLTAMTFASDTTPNLSSACAVADGHVQLPPAGDVDFLARLGGECDRLQISLVIPTIDTELEVLAGARKQFALAGVALAVSDAALVKASSDKRETPALLASQGLAVPPHLAAEDIEFPVFVKPRDGSSSRDVHVVRHLSELRPEHVAGDRYLIQEYLDPLDYDEFTVDMYFDQKSELKCLVPRLRIDTRAGEVSKARTVRDQVYDKLLGMFATWPGARGCLTLQLFADRGRSKLMGIEVNPRFGGGYPLSFRAGARYPEWLIREYMLGETIPFFDEWESDLLMLRYDEGIFVSASSHDA